MGQRTEATMLTAGARLGPYEIIEQIGAGSMGHVYRARDTRLHRDVAIKVLTPAYVSDPDRAARFEEEARAAAAFNHQNILAVYDVGIHEGAPFLVTELLDGRTLRDVLNRGRLPLDAALRYARQIANGLAAAHSRHVVHRDLKPENVFVLVDDRVKILDFGVATRVATADLDDAPTTGGTDMLFGTPGYMAPEQITARPVDPRADIFAFGAVLFEMLTAVPAFRRPTVFESMRATVSDEPEGLGSLDSAAPAPVADIVRRCLAKSPAARIQRMTEIIDVLDQPALPATSPASRPLPTIAVLPFADLSAARDHEYFCDGISEELLNALTKVPGLRVASRTSSFQFKGSAIDVTEAARRLHVSNVLEGSVRAARNRLRITVHLVEAATGLQVWAETYDRTLDDIFAVQEEIAHTVVAALRVTLQSPQTLVADGPADVAAYTLYLRGRHHWNRRAPDDLARSIVYYRQALERDPRYMQAHAALAEAHFTQALYGVVPPADAMGQARDEARHALALFSGSAQALTVLAAVQSMYEWRWDEGEETFRRAVAADAQYATSHHWYASQHLIPLGRFGEAAGHVATALHLDPLSLAINTTDGTCAYFSGDYEAAAEKFARCLELDATFVLARIFLGLTHSERSRHDEAVDELQRAVRISGGSSESQSALGYGLARAGRTAEARAFLDLLVARATEQYVPSVAAATVATALGDVDSAFAYLNHACDERAPGLAWIRVRPAFRTLRNDPRYAAIVARMGFPLDPREVSRSV